MKKVLAWIALGLGIIAAVFFFYFKKNKLRDFEPQMKAKISSLVKQASGGLYNLEIGKLEVDVIASKVILIDAHLIPDTVLYNKLLQQKLAPADIFDIEVNTLVINGLSAPDFLAGKAVNLGTLFIDEPEIHVYHRKISYPSPNEDSSKTVYEQISKDVSSIQLDTLLIKNIDFTYHNLSRNNKQTKFKKVNVVFTGFLLDSTSQYDKDRFLYAKDCRINVKDYDFNSSDSLYQLRAGEIDVQTNSKTMEVKKLRLKPRVKRKQFYEQKKHEADIFNVDINDITIENVQWWSLLAEESFVANTAILRNGKVEIFRDKTVRDDTSSKIGKYPHQLLMKVPFDLNVSRLEVKNLDVSYEELNEKTLQTGTVLFTNISGTLTNITNNESQIRENQFCKIIASAKFLNEAPIKIQFIFDLKAIKTGDFEVIAHMDNLNGEKLNSITEPLGLLKINSLNIKSLDASMKANNLRSVGKVKLIYDNLKVTALKDDGTDSLKKRGLFTFIANSFIIKKENEEGKSVRVAYVTRDRVKEKSFFNLIWKTIFMGAGETAGYKVKQGK
jgi:hypothetical protein